MTTGVDVTLGAGCLPVVADLVRRWAPDRVLVVGSERARARTGILDLLGAVAVDTFDQFTPNPRLTDVLRGCERAYRRRPGLIVGVGGGSSMDVAKLIRVLPPGEAGARTVVGGSADDLRRPGPGLVLVPTTSGTGSEVTRFATVYHAQRKYSVDHHAVLANAAVIDPELAGTCPPEVMFSCLLDALAHAIESYWSVRSTVASRALAGQALELLVPLANGGVRELTVEDRTGLASASLLAGRAIDLTRTTAAHAFAYPTTMRLGVPHGLACALHLCWLLDYVHRLHGPLCADRRGADFVGARLAELAAMLGAAGPQELGARMTAIVASVGFETRMRAYAASGHELDELVGQALSSTRAVNSPVRVEPGPARRMLLARW
ncbi:phosphonoacetaldehyde reductase [Actinoplanes subtropicus]|uniref:phosphonoacetaldehyde reductase n=1 Tax=Actinoplanes subtropicus TaxID=543632 RepID=UPI00068F8E30|nr:phosphonoacetaldehyde reductase [Actinoplanes subtropicus]